MIKINFHMHSTGSDGHLSPEEVVKEAIANGIHFMCFTDHYRRPKEQENDWSTVGFHPLEYVKEIRNLQKKYKNKIDISFGAEFDWSPNHIDWIKKELSREKYDFVIGSVHLIFNGKEFVQYMASRGHWEESSKNAGGFDKLIKEYYRQTRLMIESGLFDCVGHLDVIKMHNVNSKYFSEEESWYKKEVIKTLDVLQKSKMALEINTGGLGLDVGVQYPSLWILKESRKRNIPLTIGTDSHNKETIGKELQFAYDLAREAGYKKIVRFKDRKMIDIYI